MFGDEIAAVSNAAKVKNNLLGENPGGFILAAVLAGMFVGLSVVFAFTVGGLLTGNPFARILMGCAFGIALSLIVMAGGELFTGNNFVMAVGFIKKTVSAGACFKIWGVSYLGNLIGSIIIAVIFVWCGLASGSVREFISGAAAAKMSLPPLALVCRGVLCNMLVCLAVWCTFRCKSETAKLIMIFWCLLAFITTGYEHSVANMTLLTVSLLSPAAGVAVSLGGWVYNIALSTIGNIIGGIVFVALPYSAIGKPMSTS
ncbi:MAG: formate/nitrite transporter family protein [Treponema sp.]|jgi:nitrite transporter NirC|nr:formate/nitrite transporter family protein [Treponema sp.]